MKILIGTDENTLDSHMSKRFGHANFYLIYNSENENVYFEENKHDESAEHNHNNLFTLLGKGVDLTIVGNIGPHAYQILATEGRKLYLARAMTASQAIEKFNNGELRELTEPTVKQSIEENKHHEGHHH